MGADSRLGLSMFPRAEVQLSNGTPDHQLFLQPMGSLCWARHPALSAGSSPLLLGSLPLTPAGGGAREAHREPMSTALLGVRIREGLESCTLQRRPEPCAPASLGLAPRACPPRHLSPSGQAHVLGGLVTGHPISPACCRVSAGAPPGGHRTSAVHPGARSGDAVVLFLGPFLLVPDSEQGLPWWMHKGKEWAWLSPCGR